MDKVEGEILSTIAQLWKEAEDNPHKKPAFDSLRREMVDRKIKEKKDLIERYGRYLKEKPKKISGLSQQTFQKAAEAATGMLIHPIEAQGFYFRFPPARKNQLFYDLKEKMSDKRMTFTFCSDGTKAPYDLNSCWNCCGKESL